ncbi:MAG: phosphoglycerate kinase, partial [Candidatus Nanohaloarchaea archaeon]
MVVVDGETLEDEKVLIRVDLNSPVEDGEVQDNKRFEKHAETMQDLLE